MSNLNAAIRDTMKQMFTECQTLSDEIGVRYVEGRSLGNSESANAQKNRLVTEIASLGVQLAAAFTGMIMTAELSKAMGLTAQDIIDATAVEVPVEVTEQEGSEAATL